MELLSLLTVWSCSVYGQCGIALCTDIIFIFLFFYCTGTALFMDKVSRDYSVYGQSVEHVCLLLFGVLFCFVFDIMELL